MSKICNNCGGQLDDDALFCDICGANLSGQPDVPPPNPKKKKGLMIALVIFGVMAVFAIAVIIIVLVPLFKPHGVRQESETESSYVSAQSEASNESSETKESAVVHESSETEKSQNEETSAESSYEISKEDESSEQEISDVESSAESTAAESSVVESSAESSVQESSDESSAPQSSVQQEKSNAETKLPYADNLGKISPNNFTWISDAMSGNIDGRFLSNDELVGKWKAEIIFDGIWELAYITIDTDGTVTVEPYQINYGDGWEDESDEDSYNFNGTFDLNRVHGSGIFGEIDLYKFIESHGTQYALGEINPDLSDKASIYMIRP